MHEAENVAHCKEKRLSIGGDTDMAQTLELSNKDMKIPKTKIPKDLVKVVTDNMCKCMGEIWAETSHLQKCIQIGMLEMKSMILRMKNFLHQLNSSIKKKEKMISASQGRSMENMQRETPRQKSTEIKNKQKYLGSLRWFLSSKITVTEVLEEEKENGEKKERKILRDGYQEHLKVMKTSSDTSKSLIESQPG